MTMISSGFQPISCWRNEGVSSYIPFKPPGKSFSIDAHEICERHILHKTLQIGINKSTRKVAGLERRGDPNSRYSDMVSKLWKNS